MENLRRPETRSLHCSSVLQSHVSQLSCHSKRQYITANQEMQGFFYTSSFPDKHRETDSSLMAFLKPVKPKRHIVFLSPSKRERSVAHRESFPRSHGSFLLFAAKCIKKSSFDLHNLNFILPFQRSPAQLPHCRIRRIPRTRHLP